LYVDSRYPLFGCHKDQDKLNWAAKLNFLFSESNSSSNSTASITPLLQAVENATNSFYPNSTYLLKNYLFLVLRELFWLQ
jgi:hypothetical protein